RHVQEREQRRQGRLQRPVQRKQLAGDFLTDLAQVVAWLDLEVTAEQLDHREIRRRLAVRYAHRFDHEGAGRATRMRELPEQTRFAHARLTDDSDDLAPAAPREIEGFRELIELARPSDELREPARCAGVEA